MTASVVLLTRALRVHDHPALATATRAGTTVPLFVVDDAVRDAGFVTPNRATFLAGALAGLRADLQDRGGDLVVRRGDPVARTVELARQLGATTVHATADVTAFAHRRQDALAEACREAGLELVLHPGVSVVEPGSVRPGGGDHYKVFTPFFRAWTDAPRRRRATTPDAVALPDGIDPGELPTAHSLAPGPVSPHLPEPGERAALAAVDAWVALGLAGYDDGHDDLAGDRTSRLSPYLHFGCLSPLELEHRATGHVGAEPFLRQLCWRDFYHQVTAAFGAIGHCDYRPRGERHWVDDDDAFAAWTEGRTGYPIVDAGMRQLRDEGWMHNRARLLTASFLVKDLGIDWRRGAAHFLQWLVDGDLAQNSANWQWVAGTGNDTRPNRIFNPIRQAERFDPDGAYVRRWVPELDDVAAKVVHKPWALGVDGLTEHGYPPPIVDHHAAAADVRAGRPPAGVDQDHLPGLG